MLIKKLFDPSKDIYRTIEKVITYNTAQEKRLKAEITEYIVTDSIEDQFEKLLSKMQHNSASILPDQIPDCLSASSTRCKRLAKAG